jgi:hypothetical protein
VDAPPTGPDGQCKGIALFQIKEGNLDDTDLSGTAVAFVNFFPSNLTSGGWKLGIVVNEEASDDQASAIERIMKGEEGGAFGEFAALTDEWLGMERGKVVLSNGDRPSATVKDAEFTFEPLPGPEGSDAQTTVRNAMFGFAEEYRVGKAPTKSKLFGLDFDGVYGETADYEFASEMEEGAPKGRG